MEDAVHRIEVSAEVGHEEETEAPAGPPPEVIARRLDDMPAVVRAMLLGYDEA